ncbi:MAG: lyase family protein [Acidilobaceae archaeon]
MKYVPKATEVFLDTGTRFPRRIIWAMGLIKYAAANANSRLGLLDNNIANAIMKASLEVAEGLHDDKIIVDVFQTGSGTGLNMNINEVIASRASELSGAKIHPNDHVNMGQSSNDVVPTAIRVALLYEVKNRVLVELSRAYKSLEDLAIRTSSVIKPGRTHLRDALPVTMGQEFQAYADALERDYKLLEYTSGLLLEVPLGGTAVGTGLNTHPEYPNLAIGYLSELTGLNLKPARSNFRAMRLLTDIVAVSSAIKITALDLWRLCQDLRLMYSGPFTGISEIDIPQEVPGSSMMPGKVNPVTVEAVMQASSHIVGLDSSIVMASLLGEFELSMGITLAGYASLRQATIISESLRKIVDHVITMIKPLEDRARRLAENSQALVTIIAPIIGYDKAAEVSRKLLEGKTLREVLRDLGFSEEYINDILDLEKLVKPGIPVFRRKE